MLLGVALGLFLSPNLSYIMGSVPRDQLGVAGGDGDDDAEPRRGHLRGAADGDLRGEVGSSTIPAPGRRARAQFVIPAFQDAFTVAALLCLVAVGLALIRETGQAGRGSGPWRMKRLKVGVVGIGFIGAAHVDAIRRVPYAEVVAVASSTTERARRHADDLGIERAYGDYRELLADPDVDVVHNCTPNRLALPDQPRHDPGRQGVLLGEAADAERRRGG